MKLLFDENLSPKLATNLAAEYPGSVDIRDIGRRGAADHAIWDHAIQAMKSSVIHTIERVLTSRDGTWKAEIFRRQDGTYGFTPFRWSREHERWLDQQAGSFTTSADAAEIEARARVPQLGNARRTNP